MKKPKQKINLECRGCKAYIIQGRRRCKRIFRRHYKKYKTLCPCPNCFVKPMCKMQLNWGTPPNDCPESIESIKKMYEWIKEYDKEHYYRKPSGYYHY
jgi:hypothetical protein